MEEYLENSNENVNLSARGELGHDGRLEDLLDHQRDLYRSPTSLKLISRRNKELKREEEGPVTAHALLSLACAEVRHAVLAIDHSLVELGLAGMGYLEIEG